MSATSVRIERVFPAEIERVFEAWSDAQLLARWFVVDPEWTAKAANDFRVGGRYRVEMHRPDGTVFVCWGTYLEIERPRRLVFTWNSTVPAVQNSRVTIQLASGGSEGGQTALTLLHELLPDTAEGRAHAVGWEGSLANLERFLSNVESRRRP
ncbi:MAG: SRPBCC domain-containing protein [Chloroflexi bacterium]|nr:SRPBCC domain-containing protein [Chloroflexota bacterium]